MSIPKTCKAAVYESAGKLSVKEIPVRAPGPNEVLVKVLACGLCHTDQFIGGGAFGDVFPRVPGHELIGNVVAKGDSVSQYKEGDRVGGPWYGGADTTCTQCQRGQFQMCQNGEVNGLTRDGGYAEYVVLREEATVPIPKDADPAETAPLLCAGVTTFNSMRSMGIKPGETVAVQGLGGLGHLGVSFARKMGYKTVALSSSGAKRDMAMNLGAHEYVDASKEDHAEALQKMGGAALIVVTAPNAQIISPLLNGLCPGGKLLILAPVGEVPVNTATMISKGLSVHGWPSGHKLDSQETIAFANTHGIKCMIEKFTLDNVHEGIERVKSGKIRFRGVLTF